MASIGARGRIYTSPSMLGETKYRFEVPITVESGRIRSYNWAGPLLAWICHPLEHGSTGGEEWKQELERPPENVW